MKPRRRLDRSTLAITLLVAGVAQTAAAKAILTFEVTPAAPGPQLVRRSLPFAPDAWPTQRRIVIDDGAHAISPGVRVLATHPAEDPARRSVRRAMVTFPFDFAQGNATVAFHVRLTDGRLPETARRVALGRPFQMGPTTISLDANAVTLTYAKAEPLVATAIGPSIVQPTTPTVTVIESNRYFLWLRYDRRDDKWRRAIELRADALGTVILIQHLQRFAKDDGYTPRLGWAVTAHAGTATLRSGETDLAVSADRIRHSFENEASVRLVIPKAGVILTHPVAPYKLKGHVEAGLLDGKLTYQYLRSTGEADAIPHQPTAWRKAELVIAPTAQAVPTVTLESPHRYQIPSTALRAAYGLSAPVDPRVLREHPALARAMKHHHDLIPQMVLHGDDFGNVTGLGGNGRAAIFGMNRLNHCPPIFDEYDRTGLDALRRTAVLWCENFYDLTIWWGKPHYGGTRYNNVNAMGVKDHLDDKHFMWRSNSAVHFCTKGFCSFLSAFEETGDPRMTEALDAQLAYAREAIHTNQGECRNIGDVYDFLRLYRYSANADDRAQAMRLFRELRTKLMPDDLFSQGGQPIHTGDEFIASDKVGYRFPFAKPYIIGYALTGLPDLLARNPDEPRLRGTVTAVADFLVNSQDRTGGWRYPHPRSPRVILSQSIEHAWQITQAARVIGAKENLLDAVERVLKLRIKAIQRHERILGGLGSWETATGKIRSEAEWGTLYKTFAERDAEPDYTLGKIAFGTPIEGVVYFPEVLAWYLRHRPPEPLLAPDVFLDAFIARAKSSPRSVPASDHE